MHKSLALCIGMMMFCLNLGCGAQADPSSAPVERVLPALIPAPSKLTFGIGSYVLSPEDPLNFTRELAQEAALLQAYLLNIAGFRSNGSADRPGILLSVEEHNEAHEEAYELIIDGSSGIKISGNNAAGVSRGIQTLRQIMMQSERDGTSLVLPVCTISDDPKFDHRGMLLDPCRHFFPKEVVKKYIDLLAFYRMNTLHWHLTEDQGWRIAIDKYPKLTEVGAWRKDGTEKYGGFYTKDDVREVVAYATQRHIQVIPEIELPGHSQAAIAAYPHLSCTGQQVEVANDWGVFKEIYCAGNDSVFVFLEDVLTEVMELFPGPYIHIGGDEAPKARWEQCAKCQQRIQKEHLKDVHGLQSWTIRRIERFLAAHGRTLIGWDEILEGGLAETAVVQSWRGIDGGIEAVKHGNRAIMSPTSHCYFDYGLDATDMEEVYDFDPIPDGLTSAQRDLIIGGECNLWSEHIPDEKTLDEKTFPRLLAMSEVLWSYPLDRDHALFKDRVRAHRAILELLDVSCGLETVPVNFQFPAGAPPHLVAQINVDDVTIRGTVDSTDPGPHSPLIDRDIAFEGNVVIRAQAFRGEKALDRPVEFRAIDHAARGLEYEVDSTYNAWYPAGGHGALTDGVLGTTNFRDGHWQGYWGHDLNLVIDLQQEMGVGYIAAEFFHYSNAWILTPKEVHMETSLDGYRWDTWSMVQGKNTAKDVGRHIERIGHRSPGPARPVRFIRMHVRSRGNMPSWHEAAGQPSWIFIDELIIQ